MNRRTVAAALTIFACDQVYAPPVDEPCPGDAKCHAQGGAPGEPTAGAGGDAVPSGGTAMGGNEASSGRAATAGAGGDDPNCSDGACGGASSGGESAGGALSGGAVSGGSSAGGGSDGGASTGTGGAVTIGGGGAGAADDGSVRRDCTPGNAEVELFCFPPSSDVSYPFLMSAFRFKYPNAADPARTVSAAAINTHGVAVGTRITCHPDPTPFAVYQKIRHAFSYADGVFTLLSDHSSGAFDINDKGTILGFIDAQTVLWRDGEIVWLPGNSPIAINEHDQVLMQDGLRGALWADDITTEIGDYIKVFDLNDVGEVIGMHTGPGASSLAFVWKDGVFHDLPPLAGDNVTRAEAINNQGQVVGWSRGEQTSPVIWENGIPRVLWPKPVDSVLIEATDINDAGTIVGMLGEGTFSYSSGTLVGVGGLREPLQVNDNGVIFGPRFIWNRSCYDICCNAASRQ